MSIDKQLYKEIKQYTKLENHWINAKLNKNSQGISKKNYFKINFDLSKNKSYFRISHRLLRRKYLIKKNEMSVREYAASQNNQINLWYSGSGVKLTCPSKNIYLSKQYIQKERYRNKKFFKNMEYEPHLNLLKDKQLKLFTHKNIWNKIYKLNYAKTINKALLKNLIRKENHIYLSKKENIRVKSILLGNTRKGLVMYIPEITKFIFLNYKNIHKDLNRFFNKKLNKDVDKYELYEIYRDSNLYHNIDISKKR